MTESPWLKAEECATALQVSRELLYDMARKDQFSRVKWAGKEVRIHRDEIYPPIAETTPTRALRALAEIRQRLDELEKEII